MNIRQKQALHGRIDPNKQQTNEKLLRFSSREMQCKVTMSDYFTSVAITHISGRKHRKRLSHKLIVETWNIIVFFWKVALLKLCIIYMGFPGCAAGKEPTCQCRRCKRPEFDFWVRKIHWRRAWQPTPVFLSGESHGQRSLAGYSP